MKPNPILMISMALPIQVDCYFSIHLMFFVSQKSETAVLSHID